MIRPAGVFIPSASPNLWDSGLFMVFVDAAHGRVFCNWLSGLPDANISIYSRLNLRQDDLSIIAAEKLTTSAVAFIYS